MPVWVKGDRKELGDAPLRDYALDNQTENDAHSLQSRNGIPYIVSGAWRLTDCLT